MMQLLGNTVLARVGGLAVALAITGAGQAQTILYVDDDAPPGGNGQGWPTAYRFLQDALAAASQPGAAVDEIHVAQGLYKPDRDEANPAGTGEREATFQLIENLALMGGYAGIGAPDPDERNIELYETILSGDLAGDDEPNFVNYEENCYHVVSGANVGATSISGLTIRSGNANGASEAQRRGGGVHANAAQVSIECSVFIGNKAGDLGGAVSAVNGAIDVADCEFHHNRAGNQIDEGGGAIAIISGSAVIAECTLVQNDARLGGAVYNGQSCLVENCQFQSSGAFRGGSIYTSSDDLAVSNCTFLNPPGTPYANGTDGGAICCEGANPLIVNCTFTDLTAYRWGGAIFNDSANPLIFGCTFSNLEALESGGAIFNDYGSSPTISQCNFLGNRVMDPDYWGSGGGAIANHGSCDPLIMDCSFVGNQATEPDPNPQHPRSFGGAVSNEHSEPTMIRCLFAENLTDGHGGAVYNRYACSPRFIDCWFIDNEVMIQGGGAICALQGATPEITACVFLGNRAGWGGALGWAFDAGGFVRDCIIAGNSVTLFDGGGVSCYGDAVPVMINCTLSGNFAELARGGAVASHMDSNPSLVNCSLVANSADSADGGGVFVGRTTCNAGSASHVTLENCILWNNSDASGSGEAAQIYLDPGGDFTTSIHYSCLQDWTGVFGGEGNIGDDPLLIDPDGPDDIVGTEDDDLRLASGSPCIDAADNTAVPPDILTDLLGNPRFVDDPLTPDTGFGDPPIVDMGAYEYQPDDCPADVNGDGIVDVLDMLAVLAAWGQSGVPEDINGDGIVDVLDLLAVLAAWGPCGGHP